MCVDIGVYLWYYLSMLYKKKERIMKLADNFIERLTECNIFLGFDKNQKPQG